MLRKKRILILNKECKSHELFCNNLYIEIIHSVFIFSIYFLLSRSRSAAIGAARIKKMKSRDELLEVR